MGHRNCTRHEEIERKCLPIGIYSIAIYHVFCSYALENYTRNVIITISLRDASNLVENSFNCKFSFNFFGDTGTFRIKLHHFNC